MKRAFCDDKFTGFERPFLKTTFVCFKDYDESIPNKLIAFEKEMCIRDRCNGMDVAKISDVAGKGMCKNPDYVDYLNRCIDYRMKNDK